MCYEYVLGMMWLGPLLLSRMPAGALVRSQDPLQGLAGLQGQPGGGGDEEGARGARTTTRGVDHEETMFTAHKIGFLLKGQGKLKEAEVFLRRLSRDWSGLWDPITMIRS